MNEQQTKKKRFGALDYMILLLALVCVGSVAFRVITNLAEKKSNMKEYTLDFQIFGIRESSFENYLEGAEDGLNFYLDDGDVELGKLDQENLNKTTASRFFDLLNGTLERVTAPELEDGLTKVDVTGTFTVKGVMDEESGTFLLNGNRYLALNKEVLIYSKYLSVTILVTGITVKDTSK